jgi:hypothetical protein
VTRNMILKYVYPIICFLLLLPAVNGCSKTEVENTFSKLLTLLPASAKNGGVITIVDYKRIWEANGLSLYTSGNTKVSSGDFLNTMEKMESDNQSIGTDALFLGSYYTGWGIYMAVSPINIKNVGYDFSNVEAEINNIGIRPDSNAGPFWEGSIDSDIMIAAIGSYDSKVTKNALNNKSEWPSWAVEKYTTYSYRDTIIHSWGDSKEWHSKDRLSPPHQNPSGQAVPLAINDSHLFVADSVNNIKSMIDASLGKSKSLADVPELSLAAKGMYELGAYGAIIAYESLVHESVYPEIQQQGPRLKKFITFGTGPGWDKNGDYIALVIVHDNEDVAKENKVLLEQRINAMTYNGQAFNDIVNATEISIDGKVLLAKLYTQSKTLWRFWVMDQGPLLLHEN